jgi:hypothetical protein
MSFCHVSDSKNNGWKVDMPEGERWCVDLVLFSSFLLVLDPPVFRIVLPENKT